MKRYSLIVAISLLLARIALGDITVTVTAPGGSASDTLPDAGGAFELNIPLNRNAVNTIRVTATDAFGNQDEAELAVTQVSLDQIVVSKLTTERLSTEEVEQLVADGVIQLDDPANFNVSEFTIVLTIDKEEVPITLPIALPIGEEPQTGYETYKRPQGDSGSDRPPPPPPPQIIFFAHEISKIVEGVSLPPVPGVIIIEGRIKSLKEFFSVRLMLLNTSGIFTLEEVVAELEFPDGGLTAILPADGIVDLGEILPGGPDEPGQVEREFIIRGDEVGVRDVKVNFGGVVTGPGIAADDAIPFNGSAVADVEVMGPPQFLVKVEHPDSVTVGVPYDLAVQILNDGELPALYASLDLDVSADAELAECTVDPVTGDPDCVYVSEPVTRLLGHIQPGEWVSETFTVVPLVSGRITSCVGASDQNITLQVAVGDLGCVTGHFPPDQDVPLGIPSVTVVPAPNTQQLSPDTPVAAFFSEQMNKFSITTGEGGSFNVFDAAGNRVTGQLRIETNLLERTIAIWQKPGGLAPGEEYTVWVTQDVRDLDGTNLFYQLVDQKTVFSGNAPPFVFSLDSANLTPGHSYQLLCSAYDGRGNIGNATISILVAPTANPPTIVLPDDPVSNVLHGISVRLRPVLTGGVRRVRYYLDAQPDPYKTVTLAPFQATLSTLNLALTNHTITVVATNNLGVGNNPSDPESYFEFTIVEPPPGAPPPPPSVSDVTVPAVDGTVRVSGVA